MVQSQLESYQRLKKMILDASLLNSQHYKIGIKGKVEQSTPTPQCSSYWKGSLQIALDYDCQLYLYIHTHSLTHIYVDNFFVFLYVYVCVCEKESYIRNPKWKLYLWFSICIHMWIHTETYTPAYIERLFCVSVCFCVWLREREQER